MSIEYVTSDLALAAFLVANDIPIEAITQTDQLSHRKAFHFKNSEEIIDIAEKFRAQKMFVEPIKYFNAIRRVKQQMYDGK